MFCPRCGQQAAGGVSFCSRCGLPLDAAAEIVASGGGVGTEAAVREPSATLTARQRGTRKGLIIVVAGALFFVIAALLTAFLRDELFPFMIIAGVVLVIGVARMLYGLLLEENAPPKKKSKRAEDSRDELGRTHARAGELPPAHSIPASLYTKPGAGTSDMAAPASVTENTTKLLDEDEAARRP
jgi:hypothetical protein